MSRHTGSNLYHPTTWPHLQGTTWGAALDPPMMRKRAQSPQEGSQTDYPRQTCWWVGTRLWRREYRKNVNYTNNNQKVEWLSDSILEETLATRVLNIMHCWPEMARSARVLQYWLIRTYKEGWSSNHISILQWSHIYIKGYSTVYIPCLKFRKLSRIEIMCLQGFQTLTSGDLTWPPWKTLGIIYPPRAINILSLKFRQLSLIEIPCLQGFQTLTSGDLKWPLTSMENNRDHLRTKGYQHTKFEVQATFTYWDTMFTRFSVF